MSKPRAVVIGAGIGGLVAALRLARRGLDVTLVERAAEIGGKMRTLRAGGLVLDAGPTVLTMRWVFDELFAEAGAHFDRMVPLARAEVLARHAWQDGSALDLFADLAASADAIGSFAGKREADGYRRFMAYARAMYETVREPFLLGERPTVMSMARAASRMGLGALRRVDGHRTLWAALGNFFRDARLRQLFGRYATYAGSSPFAAPATLSVIAHVEQEGVFWVDGGMHALADALGELCRANGVAFRLGAEARAIETSRGGVRGLTLKSGDRLPADIIVYNGEPNALSIDGEAVGVKSGPRSLSALTFALIGRARGLPLTRHNVMFSNDYAREFEELFGRSQLPNDPTVYVCAQDRAATASNDRSQDERLFCLMNAPALEGPEARPNPETQEEASKDSRETIEQCAHRMWKVMLRCGIEIEPTAAPVVTTPSDFARRFPGSDGALYGAASHGMMTPFSRAPTRGSTRGLYFAGGSCHPGAGVPMVALSGRLAAESALSDFASTVVSRQAPMLGGIST